MDITDLYYILGLSARGHRVTYMQRAHSTKKSVTRFLLRIVVRGVNASMHLLESKSQQVHKLLSSFFYKNGYTVCTYRFFKHVPQSFAPKHERRHIEIFWKGDGLSLVHLLGIKAVTLKSYRQRRRVSSLYFSLWRGEKVSAPLLTWL